MATGAAAGGVSDEAAAAVGLAEPFLRLSLGWQALGVLDEAGVDLLEAWAARIGAVCDAVGADVGPGAGRLRCWAEGASDGVIPVLAALLAEGGATQADLDLVTAVGAVLDPARLGGWAEVRGDDRSLGWYLGNVPTGALVTWLPWTSELDSGWAVRRWSRSVGPAPVDVLELAVPGSGDDAIVDATGALASCGVALPPDAALGALARCADDGVGVELVAIGGTVVGGGIETSAEGIDAVVDVLHALGGAEREVDRVARLRGGAGEPQILGVGVTSRPRGVDAFVRLRLA